MKSRERDVEEDVLEQGQMVNSMRVIPLCVSHTHTYIHLLLLLVQQLQYNDTDLLDDFLIKALKVVVKEHPEVHSLSSTDKFIWF